MIHAGKSSGKCAAQTSVHSCATSLEHRVELYARACIEPARGLVEQQHRRARTRRRVRSARAAARRATARGSGAARKLGDAESLQHRRAARSRWPASGLPARHVGAVDARQHDVERREVPVPARVPILELVARRATISPRARTASVSAPRAEVVASVARARARARSVPAIKPSSVLLPLPLAPTTPQRSPRSESPCDVVQHGAPARSTST